jgi:pheromone shutdown protein TraB
MSTIVVIGTYHVEDGACKSEELLKIIEKITPDVIFCEAAPEVFPKMIEATETFNPPEIKVIREILKDSTV